MWKQSVGASLMVAALVGPLALETRSSSTAQPGPPLTATLAPMYVNPGGQVTVTALQPCPQPMQVMWSLGPGALSGTVATGPDGKWVVRFPAPAGVGNVPFFAHCAFSQGAAAAAMYQQINFTVVAPVRPRYTG